MADLEPGQPREAGIREKTPEAMQVEAGAKLADKARRALLERGFTDDEIDRWAQTYVAEHDSGDVETFIEWMAARQSG